MVNKKYVVVNGRVYSGTTGLPMDDIRVDPAKLQLRKNPENQAAARGAAPSNIHASHTQKSITLNRRHVKQPAKVPLAARPQKVRAPISQNTAVNKFAPESGKTLEQKNTQPDRPAETHPVAHRAKEHQASINTQLRRERQTPPVPIIKRDEPAIAKPVEAAAPAQRPATVKAVKTAKELKNDAIAEALAREVADTKKHRVKHRSNRFARITSIFSAGLAIMLLGGYLTYLSMPNISIKMAAVQSGINAKYPGYKPDGYALNGPIKFKSGEVSMKYAYADGSSEYTLTQQKSNWDSAAVKEYFTEKSKSPTTTMVDGLTIYSSGKNAVWVNGGILYQITGSANLSNEQIQKIATSL